MIIPTWVTEIREGMKRHHSARKKVVAARKKVGSIVAASATDSGEHHSSVVAVLGTGSAGMKHLHRLRDHGVKCVAVSARPYDGEKSKRVTELEAMGFLASSSLIETVEKYSPTRLIIATDSGRHHDGAINGMTLGFRDILVEKPLAVNIAQASKILNEAAKVGATVWTSAPLRFSLLRDAGGDLISLKAVKDYIGLIARVYSVMVECHSYLPTWRDNRGPNGYKESYSARPSEGGVLLDLIHDIDYSCWLLGYPEKVQASVRNLGILGIHAPEIANILWTTPLGASLSMSLDYLSKVSRRSLCVRSLQLQEPLSYRWGTGEEAGATDSPLSELFRRQDIAFIGCEHALREEADPTLLATGLEGAKDVAVAQAAMESSLQERVIKVTYP